MKKFKERKSRGRAEQEEQKPKMTEAVVSNLPKGLSPSILALIFSLNTMSKNAFSELLDELMGANRSA